MDNKVFYCENCGEKLPAGSKFCSKCGTPVPDYMNNNSGTSTMGATKSNGWIKYVILAAVIVVVVILLVVLLISPGSVKLNKYMTIEASGVDGFGSVTCDFDEDAFCQDYAGKIKPEDSDITDFLGSDSYFVVEMLYDDCVDWEVVYPSSSIQNGALSNGEKIKVEWECNDNLAKDYYNKKLKYSNITYRVKGLTEAEDIDVFDYIDVVFSGEDSNGKASIEVKPAGENLGISVGDFELSPSSGLSNDTMITVNLNPVAADRLEQNYGVIPIESEKTYTVAGLAESPSDTTGNTGGVGETGNTTGSETTEFTKDKVETGEGEEVENSDYLCPYSSDRLITAEDLSAIKAAGNYGTLPAGEGLEQMIINEIYAKHGYKFATSEIQAYFEQKPWYKAIGSYESDMDVVWDRLSGIEQQNVEHLNDLL